MPTKCSVEALIGSSPLWKQVIQCTSTSPLQKKQAPLYRFAVRLKSTASTPRTFGHANVPATRLYDRRRSRPEDSPTFRMAY